MKPVLDIIPTAQGTEYLFYCPGCRAHHWARSGKYPRPVWTYSGTPYQPTFTPSIHVAPNDREMQCHFYVRTGQIQYLNDCHHELAGITVDMVAIDD